MANPQQVDAAVRILIRIGLDRVVGFVEPSQLETSTLKKTKTETQTFEGARAQIHDESTQVVDVRGAGEFAAGHVPGAINIAHTRLAARLDELPTDRPLIVHCGSGHRASFAVPFLESKGYDVVYVDDLFSKYRSIS